MREPAWDRRERTQLGALLATALICRFVVAGFTNVVSHDAAVYYLPQARAIIHGDWERGFTANIPLLYPLLVAFVHWFTGALDIAGQAVSVLAGTLTVVPVYLISRSLAGRPTAVLAGALAAICPLLVRYSGQAQSDALFGLLLAVSFLSALRLVRQPSAMSALLTGCAGGLAYLVRPEALALLPVVGGFLLGAGLRRKMTLRDAALGFASMTLAFGCLAFPQVWITHQQTGVWTISAKAGAIFKYGNEPGFGPTALEEGGERTVWEGAFQDKETYIPFSPIRSIASDPIGFAGRYGRNLGRLLLFLPRDIGVAIFVLSLVAAVVHWRGGRGWAAGEGFLAAAVLFYVLALPVFYTTRRMWVPLIPLLLPLAARRIVLMIERLYAADSAQFPAGIWRPGPARRVLPILFLFTFCQTFRPVAKYDWLWQRSPEKLVGTALRSHIRSGEPIMSHDGNVAFYAGGTHVPLPEGSPEEVMEFAVRRNVRFFAINRRWLQKRRPDLFLHFAQVRRVEGGFIMFEWLDRGLTASGDVEVRYLIEFKIIPPKPVRSVEPDGK